MSALGVREGRGGQGSRGVAKGVTDPPSPLASLWQSQGCPGSGAADPGCRQGHPRLRVHAGTGGPHPRWPRHPAGEGQRAAGEGQEAFWQKGSQPEQAFRGRWARCASHVTMKVPLAVSLLAQRQRRELLEQQACVLGLHRGLKATEHACSALQNNFHEFCQDLPSQQRRVRALTDRYHALGDQLDLR